MESNEITSLREWAPLTEVLEKIPARVQKGIFSGDLNVTCVDVVPEFLALGTDAGIVFWYNRFTGDVQKLRAEVTSPITCVKIVSSVEYMVAAGSINGQVNVFQIQKELPADLNLVAPLTKAKPIERYTIRDLHKCPITCCEWSKNGMKLFSGDKQGVIVLTEFDYQAHLSKSIEILNEAYGIVQLAVLQSFLIVSTTYRSIVCQREQNTRWKVSQIGKKDRKVMSNFGATILSTASMKSPSIICARPGLRFWISDCNGNVEQTLLFKDAVTSKPTWDIPLLNPARKPQKLLTNFGIVLMYTKNFVITHDENVLYILNLEKLQIEAVAKGFRNILDVIVCGKEIFILEGPRSLIRVSSSPEPPSKCSKIIFNPMLPPPLPVIPTTSPVEFEAEEEAVINAEECFELPPIEHIDLDTPIQVNLDSPNTQKKKAIIEQNRRIEVFDRINEMEYEESILFKSGTSRKHKKIGKKSTKNSPINGIVEIGQAINEIPIENNVNCSISSNGTTEKSDIISGDAISENKENEALDRNESSMNYQIQENELQLTTKPFLMDASFCTESTVISQPTDIDKTDKDHNSMPKEKIDGFISDNQLEFFDDLKKSTSELNNLQTLQYPAGYLNTNSSDHIGTIPIQNLEFINEEMCPAASNLKISKSTDCTNIFEDQIKDAMIHPDNSCSNNLLTTPDNSIKISKSLQFVRCQPSDTTATTSTTVPDLQEIPEYMKIPTLWNVKIEKPEDFSDHSESHSSDWELL